MRSLQGSAVKSGAVLLAVGLAVAFPGPASGFDGMGDINGDGVVDLTDAIQLVTWLFETGEVSSVCPSLVDVNDDGRIDAYDGLYLLQYMFNSGSAPGTHQPGAEPGCYGPQGFAVRNMAATIISPTSALVTWETPYPSDTKVVYGTTPEPRGGAVDVGESAYFHQALLSDLRPATTYYYSVSSKFGAWTASSDRDGEFTTIPAPADPVVRKDHPRLMLNAETLSELRLDIERGAPRYKIWDVIHRWCRAKLDAPVEELGKSDNFLDFVRAFAMAGLVTEDRALARKAVDLTLHVLSRGQDVDIRDLTESMAYVYDWLYPYLDTGLRQSLREGIWKRCLSLDATTNDKEYVVGTSHGDSKSLALGLLAIAGDDPRVAQSGILEKVIADYRYGFVATWRRFAGQDGGSSKGWWYSTFTLPFELEFFAALRSATGEDWFPSERVWCESVLDWFLFGLRGDGSYVRQGDAWIRLGLEIQDRAYGALLAKEYGNQQGQWLSLEARKAVSYWGPQSVFDLLWSDPTVAARAPRGATSRLFRNAGVVIVRESWDENSAVASFRSAEAYTMGHTHRDNCSFTLYYKGDLAIDAGIYDTHGSDHYNNYYTRTIAHNTITVFDPDEAFLKYGKPYVNDGGQRWLDAGVDVAHPWPTTPDATVDRSKGYRLGGIPKYEEGSLYTYAVGDGGPSYSDSKVDRFYRHFLWLRSVSGWDHPVILIFDDVVSTRADLRKAYLLHTEGRPTVVGRSVMARSGDGALYQWTVAPKSAKVSVVGGPGKEFWVNGKNFDPIRPPRAREVAGAWRVEISPAEPRTDDRFLHVLYFGDAGKRAPREPTGFEAGTFRGVVTGDWVVLFNGGKSALTAEYQCPIAGSRHLVCGLVPLTAYDVYVNGELRDTVTATFAGLLRFDVESPGKIQLRNRP